MAAAWNAMLSTAAVPAMLSLFTPTKPAVAAPALDSPVAPAAARTAVSLEERLSTFQAGALSLGVGDAQTHIRAIAFHPD